MSNREQRRRARVAGILAVTVAGAAGCATPSASISPGSRDVAAGVASLSSVPLDETPLRRLLSGRLHTPDTSCPPSARTRDDARPGVTSGTLFVTNWGKPIEEYDAGGSSGSPIGSLDYSGFNHPYGLSVDGNGTLYVANHDVNTALAFARGTTQPDLVLTYQIIQPLVAAANAQGDVYVVNDRGGPILIFPPGQSTPSQLGGFAYPTDVAFDSGGNVYVVDHSYGKAPPLGAVFKFSPNLRTRTNLALAALDYPVGIAIDSHDDIAISNLGNNTVTQYAPGQTQPKRTIGSAMGGICYPVYMAFNASNVLYVANNGTPPTGTVTGYKPTTKRPFITITNSINNPRGVAVDPGWHP